MLPDLLIYNYELKMNLINTNKQPYMYIKIVTLPPDSSSNLGYSHQT